MLERFIESIKRKANEAQEVKNISFQKGTRVRSTTEMSILRSIDDNVSFGGPYEREFYHASLNTEMQAAKLPQE